MLQHQESIMAISSRHYDSAWRHVPGQQDCSHMGVIVAFVIPYSVAI